MNITDRVYGDITIDEPVLLALIQSKPIQRLKGINQAGASQYALKHKTISRYEHSVGVMILLKKLGASIEEQIAGLLHDIPHTAFSHVIDFAFKDTDHKHEFHERFHEQIIMQSEIPEILKKFDFDTNRILDEHNFPLLENNIPNICADRIDYTLRDMSRANNLIEDVAEYVSSFIVHNNEIIINNKLTAKKFAEGYLQTDETEWSAPLEVALHQILADALKIALDEHIITEQDLFEDDIFVYNKLKQSGNANIQKKLDMLNPNIKITDNPDDYDFHSRNKLRYIDPKFLNPDGSVERVTDAYPDFYDILSKHKKWIEKGNFIKIVSY